MAQYFKTRLRDGCDYPTVYFYGLASDVNAYVEKNKDDYTRPPKPLKVYVVNQDEGAKLFKARAWHRSVHFDKGYVVGSEKAVRQLYAFKSDLPGLRDFDQLANLTECKVTRVKND
jgi:hypothetical protein